MGLPHACAVLIHTPPRSGLFTKHAQAPDRVTLWAIGNDCFHSPCFITLLFLQRTFSEGKTDLMARGAWFVPNQNSSIAAETPPLQGGASGKAAKTQVWGRNPRPGLSHSEVPSLPSLGLSPSEAVKGGSMCFLGPGTPSLSSYLCFYLFFKSSPKDMCFDFQRKRRVGWREKHLLVASLMCPDRGSNPQPGHVP